MPPSRSTSDPVRFNCSSTGTSASRSCRVRTSQQAEVIVLSSDEDNDDEVIVISSDNDTDAKSKNAAAPTPVGHRALTVTRILADDFGEPKMWTFSLPEPNFMDMDKFVKDAWKDPWLQNMTKAEWVTAEARLRAMSSKVHRAHPNKNDCTIHYTHAEWYPGGPIWFTIHWWNGRNLGNYFDLVDVATQKLFLPHHDLSNLFVQVKFLGGMMPVCTMEEAMCRSRGMKKIPGANDDERYNAPEGARVLFSRILLNGKKVVVADVYSPLQDRPPLTFSPFGP
ncbi:uncharacterized protein LAESUDRAFT_740283 [Laetiporus sulphureus 93-53]|uniref:Uncharacterized protein n=1 Tax=Laetiporus sulphureus 93-53 TaxID=1314785 RepID=A0A165IH42_9APHY|nr:uncharacterized protein LAESUDRAFT_740283 [Laetiporus sulphureus 93-53]KZT13064.1 hypothetical protein LAESUDRAFT_740283 [Laetiporus sulphureus 93-53]